MKHYLLLELATAPLNEAELSALTTLIRNFILTDPSIASKFGANHASFLALTNEEVERALTV